jgi:hypothetical protein
MYDAYRADLQTQEVGGTQEELTLEVKKMETKVGITSDKVTPIHLCETLELVNKTLVSEYLLYFGNCAVNATLTFSQFTGTRLLCGVLINLSIDDCDLSVLLLSLFVILTVFWGSDLLACCLLFP